MKLDATLGADLSVIGANAAAAEAAGYDGIWTAEVATDPFLPLAVAAEHTSTAALGTSIAVAFARSPMTVATIASDLQRYSQGRFILGLGSQIKPHIERRFSMPWSRPAARMREYIQALHAIWDCWNSGTPLRFEGTFYRHTLMTPFFDPSANPFGAPPVYLAAVGPKMTAVAAELADGLIIHPFTTRRYLDEVTMPTLQAELDAAGRTRSDIVTCLPAFVAAGRDDQELQAACERARRQIAFYASTPAYRPVLGLHGWGALGAELHALSRQGGWDAMATAIDDDVLTTFAAVGSPQEVARELHRRYGDLIDRLGFATQDGEPVPDELVAAVRA